MEASGYMASWRQDAVAPGVFKAFHRHIESWQRTNKQQNAKQKTGRSLYSDLLERLLFFIALAWYSL